MFQLASPSAAHVLFSPVILSDKQGWELVIGTNNNQQSIIRTVPDGNTLAMADTPHILHPDEFRWFWVTMTEKIISLGHGHLVGFQQILSFDSYYELHVRALSFTAERESECDWIFYREKG